MRPISICQCPNWDYCRRADMHVSCHLFEINLYFPIDMLLRLLLLCAGEPERFRRDGRSFDCFASPRHLSPSREYPANESMGLGLSQLRGAGMVIEKPKTLRELYQMIEGDNPAYLDAPLGITVRDSHGNVATARLPYSLWDCPRQVNSVEQGGTSLTIGLWLHEGASLRKKKS
jgi:hypothetical protein